VQNFQTIFDEKNNDQPTFGFCYSGGTFVELIQPVSGHSIFQDYLDKNPAGGIQHVAYNIPVAKLDKVISELADKGFPVITSFNIPLLKLFFSIPIKILAFLQKLWVLLKKVKRLLKK
jgi:methylmalonyl-CoA/ethylmalonyl-CoA epimerase